jgi:hypothetical protein
MATGATTNYFLPYPLSTDPVRVAGDIEQLATRIDNILNEEIEDAAALMWTGGTFTNGLTTPTYNDSTGKMSMSLAQDIQTTATPTFTGANLIGGDLYLGQSRTLIFEGSSNDAFKTTLTVANPTANRTITFQNVTGTVALTSESTLASLVNIASATGVLTVQVGYGATTNGTTKTVNIGGNGVSGSITNINIGSAVSGATGTTTINSSIVSIPSNSISLGTVTAGTWSGSFGSVSGANLTNLTAGNLTGTIPSVVLGNSSVFIGTTSIALNRSSASQSLTGITSIDGSAATLTNGRTIGMTGDVVWTSASFNGSANVTGTSTIQNSAVTYAKIQNVSAQHRVLGRISTAAGVVEELTPENMVTLINQASTAIAATKGGTGQTSYTIGDLLYASSSSALAKLAGVATGNALISGGTGTAPAWGKIGLATHVSGTLSVANGGTGTTTSTGTGSVVLSASPTLTGTPLAPTATAGTNTTQIATTQFVQSAISSAPSFLPSQTGNAGKFLTTDGTNALWTDVVDCGTP